MSYNMIIKTNNVPRQVIYGHELTETQRKAFDYYTDEELEWQSFVQYRGNIYDISEFETMSTLPEFNPLRQWDGVCTDSHFSGTVLRFCDDTDYVIMGRFIA